MWDGTFLGQLWAEPGKVYEQRTKQKVTKQEQQQEQQQQEHKPNNKQK
jgi:hypothetical protein